MRVECKADETKRNRIFDKFSVGVPRTFGEYYRLKPENVFAIKSYVMSFFAV